MRYQINGSIVVDDQDKSLTLQGHEGSVDEDQDVSCNEEEDDAVRDKSGETTIQDDPTINKIIPEDEDVKFRSLVKRSIFIKKYISLSNPELD